jgi:hypothetical protein
VPALVCRVAICADKFHVLGGTPFVITPVPVPAFANRSLRALARHMGPENVVRGIQDSAALRSLHRLVRIVEEKLVAVQILDTSSL